MTFEEILPRLKTGHTCYRMSQHNLGLGEVKTDVNIRRVPDLHSNEGEESARVIGFISISHSRGRGHMARAEESFSIWSPSVDDILASDWHDLTAGMEESRRRAEAQQKAPE